MVDRTADEAKAANIEKMGDKLGTLYSELWQEVAVLHVYWAEYVELFGTKPSRVELLNKAAGAFTHMLQEELWEIRLLHLARLTDPPMTGNKANLTLQGLPALIDDNAVKASVTALIATAVDATAFARDWRNRRIAHRDLKIALNEPGTPLADGSRADVKKAVEAISAVLNAVAGHYLKSETRFDLAARSNGALSLLYVLHDGIKAREARQERLKSGTFDPNDMGPKDL